MTNEERRAALNLARRKALGYAMAADGRSYPRASVETEYEIRMAVMWGKVAEAMKDGDPVHDATDGHPASDGVIVR